MSISNIMHMFYNIKEGFKNFWYYKKIIYQDRWYDHYFLIRLINTKLQHMVDHWDESHYVGSNFTKGRIEVMRRRIVSLEEKLDDLAYDFYVHKKYTEEEYKKNKEQLIYNTWMVFGKNYERFWD